MKLAILVLVYQVINPWNSKTYFDYNYSDPMPLASCQSALENIKNDDEFRKPITAYCDSYKQYKIKER